VQPIRQILILAALVLAFAFGARMLEGVALPSMNPQVPSLCEYLHFGFLKRVCEGEW
jgi:hypothetical protein